MAVTLAFFLSLLRFTGYFFEPLLSGEQIHAVAGEPGRAVDEAARSARTIVTWNIERGVAFEQIAGTLVAMDADVILLQEVDRFCRRSEHRDVAQQLAERLGMNWISGGEFQEIGEGSRARACVTGQAILARSSIQDAAVVRFEDQASAKWRFNPAQPRRGGRVALRATVDGIVYYSLHLESGGGSGTLRARQLDDVLDDARPRRERPVIVAGDFNATAVEAPDMIGRLTRDDFVDLVDGTGSLARRPIDWVLARAVRGTASVVRADGASDHDPLIITLAKVAETR